MGFRILNCINSWMLDDALAEHPDVDEVVRGTVGKIKNTDEFDLIFCRAVKRLESEANYDSNKIVIWDAHVDWDVWKWGLENCLVYFKKAWNSTSFPSKMHLLTWPVLDVCARIPVDLYQRDIDIGYYFKTPRLFGIREAIMESIENFDWGQGVHIESTYTLGRKYQAGSLWKHGLTIDGKFNWWQVYMHLLRRTKILFTSTGYPGFFGTDRRTSEAISSGALVFADRPIVQMPYPFEHEKHLFFFNAKDNEEILKACELAKSYLAKEKTDEREQIAKACYDHAMAHHRSRNYVDYMMEIIQRELKT